MKKFLAILVLGLLLSGCATTDSIVSSGKLKTDMSKSDLESVFFSSYAGDDPFIPGGGSSFFPNSGKEIIWGSNKKMFYVFKNVSKPVSCGTFLCKVGNGTRGTGVQYHLYKKAFPGTEKRAERGVSVETGFAVVS